MVGSFSFAGMPVIKFGSGSFKKINQIISEYGDNVLVITGGSSFRKSGKYNDLIGLLEKYSIQFHEECVSEEPSPDLVDRIVNKYREDSIELVLAIGGGSVLDTGKAVSALLTKEGSVMDYLEGVGAGKTHDGEKIPFVAVPTTSGTGSEATKNAVLSRIGENGFKKSLRHDNFVPDIAVVDPQLTISCPPEITAASGLDALTQLLGAYTSTAASPITDSLTFKGIKYAIEALIPASTDQSDNLEVRAKMSYASLISGIALANAGLGIVHGLASPIGGFFDIPHGIVCGSLLGEATAMNIHLLQQRDDNDAERYLEKYAKVGFMISDNDEILKDCIKKDVFPTKDRDQYCQLLIDTLREWIELLDIPRLGEYGIGEDDLDRIAEKTGIKNNPVVLNKEQIKEIVRLRI